MSKLATPTSLNSILFTSNYFVVFSDILTAKSSEKKSLILRYCCSSFDQF